MAKSKRLLKVLICLVFFLFIYNTHKIFAENPLKGRVLFSGRGAYILYASSSYSTGWAAENLIDGRRKRGWRSKKNSPFPHIIVFALAANADIDLLKFNNNTQENKYPGISAKEVKVEFSTVSSDSDYINVGTFILRKGAELQEYKILKTKARWIRLSIKNNYGHPSYTELRKFEAWGVFEFKILPVISNFIWILGAAIILAAFGYHEFLAHIHKAKRNEIFKRDSFKKPCLLGLIFVASGSSLSVQKLWLTVVLGVVAILLAIVFVKSMKIKAAEKQEDKS